MEGEHITLEKNIVQPVGMGDQNVCANINGFGLTIEGIGYFIEDIGKYHQ